VSEEEDQEDISYLGLDVFDPPIDAMMDIWVNRVAKMQAAITGKAIIGLLFQKYQIFDVFAHFKAIFLCERGDILNEFIDAVFTEDGRVDRFGIMNANSLFQAYESSRCPEVKFKVQLLPRDAFDELHCLDARV